MTKTDILEKIDTLYVSMVNYHAKLNSESVWLFLATLGCYSVHPSLLRGVALLVVLSLFISKAERFRKEEIPFGKRLYSYERYIFYIDFLIEDNLSEDNAAREECIKELEKCKKQISYKTIFFSGKYTTFAMCFLFWAATVVMFIAEI